MLKTDEMLQYSFYVPQTVKEQLKIANYFEHLDALILSYEQELDKLQNLKKALLEKMFF